MKNALVLIIAGFLGWYWWQKLTRTPNAAEDVIAEVQAKQEIGDAKRASAFDAEFPFASKGDMPYAGTPLTAFHSPYITGPKDLVLFPKGQHRNPYTDVLVSSGADA
jgi:hypothetical protein